MKKVFVALVATLLFSCSSDDSNVQNGFSYNGNTYDTGYAYHEPHEYAFVFSSVDRNAPSYVETRGRFDLHHPDYFLEPGTYTTSNGGIYGVVEFTENIVKENGEWTSGGEDFAYTCCAESTSNNFQSGSATINSIEYNDEGRVINIDIDYNFKWSGKQITGNYSGEVFDN